MPADLNQSPEGQSPSVRPARKESRGRFASDQRKDTQMKRYASQVRIAALTLGLGACLVIPGRKASAQVAHRPISDFINAQGTVSVFQTPEPDYLGWGTTFG